MPGEVHFTPKKITLILKDENLQWLLKIQNMSNIDKIKINVIKNANLMSN